jgi:hypothetical protein
MRGVWWGANNRFGAPTDVRGLDESRFLSLLPEAINFLGVVVGKVLEVVNWA